MDFSYSDDQQAISDLAAQIFREKASHERQRALEKRGGLRFDSELWSALAQAGLLGTPIAERHGGAGLGFVEVAALMQQAGHATAPVPIFETLVLAALPLAKFGSDAQRERWLPAIARGEAIATAALIELHADPLAPVTRSAVQGGGFVLDGTKLCVPAAEQASLVLVPASSPTGEVVIALVEPQMKGVTLTALETTSGRPESRMDLSGVRISSADVLPGGKPALGWLLQHAHAAQAAFALGVCERALELTAEYAKTRKQFDQPIAMFQAVGHRAANAYVDLQGMRLTAQQAAWRLAEGLPAEAEVAIAKYWAAEAGQRVVAACQHLHGGVGVDKEYPLHRSYLYAKELELALGGSTQSLLRLGRLLADEAAA